MSDHLIAEANRHARALTIERDQIRTELALLREWQREVIQNANAHQAERRDAIARAERAEAELAVDRARLDWLEQKKPILWALEDYASGPYWLLTDFAGYTEETASQHKTARAAIDAARKEAQP